MPPTVSIDLLLLFSKAIAECESLDLAAFILIYRVDNAVVLYEKMVRRSASSSTSDSITFEMRSDLGSPTRSDQLQCTSRDQPMPGKLSLI